MINGMGKNIIAEDIYEAKNGIEYDNSNIYKGKSFSDRLENENRKKINEAIEDKMDTIETIVSKEGSRDASGMEILPLNGYILIKPYSENPYNKLVWDNGIIVGGVTPEMKDPDSGDIKEMENIIKVGHVIEVSPMNAKGIKEGDDVYYKTFNEVPIPFFSQGLAVINEATVLVVVNERLKERYNM